MYVSSTSLLLFRLLYGLHSSSRATGEKGSWLNSGPTLYYGVLATQGTNPGWDPTSVPNCFYVPLFFYSPFHSKVWSPCNNLTGCTNSQALAISVLYSCSCSRAYHYCKVTRAPCSLICSCLAMWSSRAHRTAIPLYLPSSSSISPSTCG